MKRYQKQEMLGTTGDVLRETENEETVKCRKALKERWPNLRALFKTVYFQSEEHFSSA